MIVSLALGNINHSKMINSKCPDKLKISFSCLDSTLGVLPTTEGTLALLAGCWF